MDCGDTGHILISKHLAEDVEQYGDWKRRPRDLGECEVKHGVRVSVVNLYTEDVGNRSAGEGSRSASQSGGSGRRETGLEQKLDCRCCAHNCACLGGLLLLRRSPPAAMARRLRRHPLLPQLLLFRKKVLRCFPLKTGAKKKRTPTSPMVSRTKFSLVWRRSLI